MSEDNELVELVARAMVGVPDIPVGHTLGDINWDYFRILAERALAEVQRWHPLDDQAKALGPIMLGWAGTGFEPDKGFWDDTTQAWGYLTNEMAFEPFHRPPTHWQKLLAPPQ